MEIKIKVKVSGNCDCFNCGKEQHGRKNQPITLWYKGVDEKRGHQLPMCSVKCAEQYAKEKLN